MPELSTNTRVLHQHQLSVWIMYFAKRHAIMWGKTSRVVEYYVCVCVCVCALQPTSAAESSTRAGRRNPGLV